MYTNTYIHVSICLVWWFSHEVVSDSCKPMDCNLPGSSVHGILSARILEWVAISFSKCVCICEYFHICTHAYDSQVAQW